MRIVTGSIAIVLGLVIVLFALSNRETVEWGLWPLDGRLALPLFVPVLVCAFAALLAGGAIGWLSSARWRHLARRRERRVRQLEQEVRALQERLRARAEEAPAPPRSQPPVLRQIPGGRS